MRDYSVTWNPVDITTYGINEETFDEYDVCLGAHCDNRFGWIGYNTVEKYYWVEVYIKTNDCYDPIFAGSVDDLESGRKIILNLL